MAIVDVSKEPVPPATPVATAPPRKRRPKLRIAKSKKMLTGMVILGFFILIGVIGPWIAPYDPNALGPLTGPPMGRHRQKPSAHHCPRSDHHRRRHLLPTAGRHPADDRWCPSSPASSPPAWPS